MVSITGSIRTLDQMPSLSVVTLRSEHEELLKINKMEKYTEPITNLELVPVVVGDRIVTKA